MQENSIPVSLIVPVYNESKTIHLLIESINAQEVKPDEVILVDGGSTDDTVNILKKISSTDYRYRVIEAGRAMPGKGRNVGVKHAVHEWLVFTDAGIKLDVNWLKELKKVLYDDPAIELVYGNFEPQVNSFFEKCASIAYVPGKRAGKIRGKSIVSCMLKKAIWQKAGGFPDWRAAEDLVFMEKSEQVAAKIGYAPGANAYWELRPDIISTYKKFDLYSKYNVWAGRQAYWHYGIGRQYLLMLLPLLLALIVSPYWLIVLPLWILARVCKRILLHRNEFGWKALLNPAIVFTVAIITLAIDAGTFSGWIKALMSKNELTSDKTLAV